MIETETENGKLKMVIKDSPNDKYPVRLSVFAVEKIVAHAELIKDWYKKNAYKEQSRYK